MTALAEGDTEFHIAHVLCTDIVGYSKLMIDQQSDYLRKLNDVVRGTEQFQRAEASGKLLRIPTGDGMVLVFFTHPQDPADCSIQIATSLKTYPDIALRMGVHSENTGVPYKWGGDDTPASFDLGIRAGKAAGDVYTLEKRRLDDAAVSDAAVGIDCSGFIFRCWKTPKRYSTSSLADVCQKVQSLSALEPADIMNQPHGHVLMFVKWLDVEKKRGLFYEAAPFSKTRASQRDVSELTADGFLPMRYRHIKK